MKTPKSSFERGRVTGLPGVRSSATLYPKELTTRMFNAVFRQLREGRVTGGWSAKSRQVAQAIFRTADIAWSVASVDDDSSWRKKENTYYPYAFNVRLLEHEWVEVERLVLASFTAHRIAHGRFPYQHTLGDMNAAIEATMKHFGVNGSGRNYVGATIHDYVIGQQIQQVLERAVDRDREAREAIAERFMNREPIVIWEGD